ISYFAAGRLAYVDQVAIGGEDVTADLAYDLCTNHHHAERLKSVHGSVQFRSGDDNTRIEVPLIGDLADMPTGEVAQGWITHVARERVRQIFEAVQERMRESRPIFALRPPRTLVLTGGGSQLEGIDELAEEMFELPVRRARPDVVFGREGVEDLPCCAAASGGLVLVSGREVDLRWSDSVEAGGLSRGVVRLSRWLRENF
ncbi:MAG: cell division FtsA domain-containing protein, partial [Pseudomonadota bacterium]